MQIEEFEMKKLDDMMARNGLMVEAQAGRV